MTLQVAGQEVSNPMSIWASYAKNQHRALELYDLPGQGDPAVLTPEEVWRSRAISSRVTHAERQELPALWLAAGGADLPTDARIQDADPLERGSLYDHAQEVARQFVARHGVRYTKAYKVLHIKRPHLFPVLDARLRRLYAHVERAYRRENSGFLPDGFNYWGAIRRDVIRNEMSLQAYREKLAAGDGLLPQMATLSVLRLLDILCWKLAP